MNIITQLIRVIIPRSFRNALRRPGVSLIRVVAKLKFAMGTVSRSQLTRDIEVRCHPICQQEFSVFTKDDEQAFEMARFVEIVKPGFKFLDIGAHWGAFTLAALKKGGPTCQAMCIEASQPVARVLRENLHLNNLLSQTTVVNAACGDSNGTLHMLTTGAGGADYFVVPSENRPDVITVTQVTADSVCKEHDFAPHLLKIDVEGFEEEVIKGAKSLLCTLHPIVFLELHGDLIRARNRSPENVLKLLSEAGYKVWRTVSNGAPMLFSDLESGGFNARIFSYPHE